MAALSSDKKLLCCTVNVGLIYALSVCTEERQRCLISWTHAVELFVGALERIVECTFGN